MRIVPGRNKPAWFVQRDRHRRIEVNQFAIDFDVIAFPRLGAEICANVTINADPAGGDQFVTFSAGSDTGCGEKPIEAHVIR